MISRLLELGAVVDPRDSEGMTPLAYAVACENEKEIELLVSASYCTGKLFIASAVTCF